MTAGGPDQSSLATAELLGALAYGQLRAFQVTANAVGLAPTIALADRLAEFAIREHARYRELQAHLRSRTDLADRVMERQRGRFDAFFDAVGMEDWSSAVTFFAIGLPIAADFTRAVAVAVDDETARVLVAALTDRSEFETLARSELKQMLAGAAPDETDRIRHLVADVVGRALTGFQAAMADSDALGVLFGDDRMDGSPDVRDLAIQVLNTHRDRMVALGLDELE